MSQTIGRLIGITCGVVIAGLLAGPAAADVITYQDGLADPFAGGTYSGTRDTGINESAADKNYGYGTSIALRDFGDLENSDRRGLIRFDVTSMSGKYLSINSVTLTLTAAYGTEGDFDSSTVTVSAYEIASANSEWVEGTGPGGGSVNSGESCWNYRKYNTNVWAGSAGLETAGTDYVTPATGAHAFSGSLTAGDTFDIQVSTSLFETWVGGTNTGLLLIMTGGDDPQLWAGSRENLTASYRPMLTVDYEIIPEPSTLALLATGLIGLAMYAWRKRRAFRT